MSCKNKAKRYLYMMVIAGISLIVLNVSSMAIAMPEGNTNIAVKTFNTIKQSHYQLTLDGQLPDFPQIVLNQKQSSILELTQTVLDSAGNHLEQYEDEVIVLNLLKKFGIDKDTAGTVLYYVDSGYIHCSDRLHKLMKSMNQHNH